MVASNMRALDFSARWSAPVRAVLSKSESDAIAALDDLPFVRHEAVVIQIARHLFAEEIRASSPVEPANSRWVRAGCCDEITDCTCCNELEDSFDRKCCSC